jgi:hypothetical protein
MIWWGAKHRATAARPPRLAVQIEGTEAELLKSGTEHAAAMAKRLKAAREAFIDVVNFVAGNTKASPNAVFSGSVPYLMLAGNLMAGWQMGRAMLVAQEQLAAGDEAAFMQAKIITARFYADHLLAGCPWFAQQHCGRRRVRHRLGAGRILIVH